MFSNPWKMRMIGAYQVKYSATNIFEERKEKVVVIYFYENQFRRREVRGIDLKNITLGPALCWITIWLERKDANLPSCVSMMPDPPKPFWRRKE
jgi:hypothetical protein